MKPSPQDRVWSDFLRNGSLLSAMEVVAVSKKKRFFFWEMVYKLSLARQESVNRRRELIASVKELKLKDEDEAEQVAAHLLDQLTTSFSGAT